MPRREQKRPDEQAPRTDAAGPTIPQQVLAAGPLTADSVIALQQSAGNAKVAAAMPRPAQASAGRPPAAPAPAPAAEAALARCVAERTGSGTGRIARSPALLLRTRLRSQPQPGRALIARSITTSGGDWDTEEYELKQDVNGAGAPVPAAAGVRGLDIKIKFKPVDPVDAELIGLTQTAQSIAGGSPVFIGSAGSRSISAGDAQPTGTGAGETDESAHIDRASGYNNPIYAVKNKSSASLDDTATSPGWGQHGIHYKDSTGKAHHQEAKLIDKPRLNAAQNNSRQVFETTAIATKGAQAGTYLGSVRWGWHTDASGGFTKIPFSKLSDGVPSSTFLKSAQLWNPGKSSTGADNVDLPVPDVKVTTGPVSMQQFGPGVPISLPAGTRLQIVRDLVPPWRVGIIKVVDGPHTNRTGEVDFTEWHLIRDERA